LLDAKNPGMPKFVCRGGPLSWVDEKVFISSDLVTHSTWLYNTESGEHRKFFEDSTSAIPLQGGKYIGYIDMRSGREGRWVCEAPRVKNPSLPSPRQLDYRGKFDKSGKFHYWVKNTGELRRVSIPSGKEDIVRGVFPGLKLVYSWFDISYDGKEIVYTDARVNSKRVMIENLFK
jgi:hypothetical protein